MLGTFVLKATENRLVNFPHVLSVKPNKLEVELVFRKLNKMASPWSTNKPTYNR